MKRNLSIAIVICLVMFIATAAPAFTWKSPIPANPLQNSFSPDLQALMELKLTEDQKTQIADVLVGYKDAVQTALAALAADHDALSEVLRTTLPSESAILEAYAPVSEDMLALLLLKSQILHEIKPILNADQLEVLQNMHARRQGRAESRIELLMTLANAWIEAHQSVE